MDNYLPICRECNGLRRSYSPAVLRLILRLGTYAKNEIRHETDSGDEIIRTFLRRQKCNRARRKGA